jgi:hypothetical protein
MHVYTYLAMIPTSDILPQHRTAATKAITAATGMLTLQGDLEPDGMSPDVGFLVRTSIPMGVPPVARFHAMLAAAWFRVYSGWRHLNE